MSPLLSLSLRVGAWGLVVFSASSIQAQHRPTLHQTWLTVSDSTLEHMRGGFALDTGLLVTIGISRTLYINGALITESSLNLGQLSQLTTLQAAQIGQQLLGLNLVQNGVGNTFIPAPAAATVQAALPNQASTANAATPAANPTATVQLPATSTSTMVAVNPSATTGPTPTIAPATGSNLPPTNASGSSSAGGHSSTPSLTTVVSNIPGIGPGLVIQNSLNNQSIINATTIDASTNGLSMLRAAQLQADITNAIQQALSGR